VDLALSGRAYGTSKSAVVLICEACDFQQDGQAAAFPLRDRSLSSNAEIAVHIC